MPVGIDAQFATYVPRAGLFTHHCELVRALCDQNVQVSLSLNAWDMHEPAPNTTRAEVSVAVDRAPTHILVVPGKWQSLRMWLSPLGRLDVFCHVFGGTFSPIPNVANVFLVPDLIPQVVDYLIMGIRERSSAYYREALEHGDIVIVYSEHTKT